ncbi:MAG: hypothetical protein U9R74_06900 [Pseudomonadota bacterium]|nr:hypothetical protein [Pseudomonadota bacterium]
MTSQKSPPEITKATNPLTANPDAMDRFVQCFERSARRWEIVVYPAMFAFVLLAAYGFFLIYSLADDMRTMAQSIDPNMSRNMQLMAQSIENMNRTMKQVSGNMEYMNGHMAAMNKKMDAIEPIRVHMANMDQSMRTMVVSTDHMMRSMGSMTHQIGRPMSIMNSFMP